MEGFDKDCLTRRVISSWGGQFANLNDGVAVRISSEQVPFGQLQEEEVFVLAGDERRVFQIQDGVARELEFVLEPQLEPRSRYICEDGGYGPDTGRPIL